MIGSFIYVPADDFQQSFNPPVKSDKLRLFYTLQVSSGYIYVDYKKYPVKSFSLYVIPPNHFLMIKELFYKDYCVIELPPQFVDQTRCLAIYKLTYSDNHNVGTQKLCQSDDFTVEQKIVHFFFSILDELYETLSDRSLTHLKDALLYIQKMNESSLSLDHNVSMISNEMGYCERTLRRICYTFFGHSAKYILRYHLLLQILDCMSQRQSMSQITKRMKFSSPAALNKYVKSYFELSPSKVRDIFIHN